MPDHGGKVNKHVDQLAQLITNTTEHEPFERDGHMWAAKPQHWYCDQLGIAPATHRRLIAKPPFVRKAAIVEGRRIALLRLGEYEPMGERDYRNILSDMWRRHIGRRTSKIEFGCICGLIEVWPDGKAPQIFKLVLDNWDVFMVGAKVEATDPRYLKIPNLRFLRRFAHIGADMLAMHEQAKLAKIPTNQK